MARAGDGVTIRAREREVDITVTLTFTGLVEAEHGQTVEEQLREEVGKINLTPDQVDVETSNQRPWR